jgi:hypothetical protein
MYRQSFAAAVAVFAVPHRVQARSLRSKIRWALAHTANLMVVAETCGGVAATEHFVNLPTVNGAQSRAPDTSTVDCPVTHLSTTPYIIYIYICIGSELAGNHGQLQRGERKGATNGRRPPLPR